MVETYCDNCNERTFCEIKKCTICGNSFLSCRECGENGIIDGGCLLTCV